MLRNSPPGNADIGALERKATQSAPAHAHHGARPGPGLYRPGPRHRRCARGAVFPRAALRPAQSGLARPRPLPAVDRPLFHRAVGSAGRGRHHPGRGTCHLWRRQQPAGHVDARHHARRRNDRRLARPWPRARASARRWACASTVRRARLRRTVGRRDAGRLDLGSGDVGQPFQARRAGGADRLQRHPGRRAGRARHGAGRRQMARLRLGDIGDRRQRHEGDGRRAGAMRASATASRRRSCCARCPARACRASRPREKSHFFRIDVAQWDGIIAEFEKTVGAAQ